MSQKSGYHKNIRTKTEFTLWLSCQREEREAGLVFAWFYPSVLSQAFPGDTENPIDPFQGNMLGIEKRECGGSTGDNMIRFHKRNTKISTFPSKLKGTIKKSTSRSAGGAGDLFWLSRGFPRCVGYMLPLAFCVLESGVDRAYYHGHPLKECPIKRRRIGSFRASSTDRENVIIKIRLDSIYGEGFFFLNSGS